MEISKSLTLQNLNSAKDLIEKANVSQLKEIISRTEALRVYAQQAKKGLEIQNQVAEIKLRAERKIGGCLKEEVKQGSNQWKLQGATSLKDLGIEKTQSHRWQAVADLPEKDFEKHIEEVKKSNEELTTVGVIRLARELEFKNRITKTPPLPEGQFNVIYCDPPWQYDNSGISGAARNHYPTMETENICNLKIPSAENSVLFLWVTNPFLKEGLQVCEKWGFEYKTNIVWIKEKAGQGFYVKGQHELLFIAVKGNFRPDDSLYIRSVVEVPKTKEHSQKPEKFYEIIETLYPKGKYLELFSRQERKNWTMWGLEKPKK